MKIIRTPMKARFLMACLAAWIGMACAARDHEEGNADASIDGPVPDPVRLRLGLEGPSDGTEISVAANNASMLCFNAESDAEIEIRNFHLEISSPEGLTHAGRAQYRDLRVMDMESRTVVMGPWDLPDDALNTVQVALHDTFPIAAGVVRSFCVQLDVGNENRLSGRSLSVKLAPFQEGDVILTGNGSRLPLEQIAPAAGLMTRVVIRGIQGPSVPRRQPDVTQEELPSGVLALGDVVAFKVSLTAPGETDVLVQWLSFGVRFYNVLLPEMTFLDNARVRIAGQEDLPALSDIQSSGIGCNLVASWSNRCVSVRLEQPLRIAAGTSASVELRLRVSGVLTDGELLEIVTVGDSFGPQEGPLTEGRIDSPFANAIMWSNDGLWWYNGYYGRWAVSHGPVLVYH